MSSIDTNKKVPELRKVTIMTTGTRGDIQPFVAIGIALKKAGYAVRIMTQPSETHKILVKDFGLEYVPYGVDWGRPELAGLWREAVEAGDTLKVFKFLEMLSKTTPENSVSPSTTSSLQMRESAVPICL